MQNCVVSSLPCEWFLEKLFDFNGERDVFSYCVKKRTVVKLTSTFVLTHVPFSPGNPDEFENYQTDNEHSASYRVIYGKIPISSV